MDDMHVKAYLLSKHMTNVLVAGMDDMQNVLCLACRVTMRTPRDSRLSYCETCSRTLRAFWTRWAVYVRDMCLTRAKRANAIQGFAQQNQRDLGLRPVKRDAI